MKWLRSLRRNHGQVPDGAIYDRVEGGQAIPLDPDEEQAILEVVDENIESLDRLEATLAQQGRVLAPEVLEPWRQASPDHAVAGLKELAYKRYAAGHHRAAANSCVRALGFAAQNSADEEGTQSPELWQLLSRIHATVGRHGAARELLELAAKGMRSAGDGLPDSLRSGWNEAVASLSEDIDAGRWPEPSTSAYVPTTVTGWLESPADVEPQ